LTPCSATRLHKVGYVQRGDKFSVWAFRHLVPWSLLCAKMSIPMVDIRCPTSQGEVQESLLEMEEVGQAMACPSWCMWWRALPRSMEFLPENRLRPTMVLRLRARESTSFCCCFSCFKLFFSTL
jgi:hypothetical protein